MAKLFEFSLWDIERGKRSLRVFSSLCVFMDINPYLCSSAAHLSISPAFQFPLHYPMVSTWATLKLFIWFWVTICSSNSRSWLTSSKSIWVIFSCPSIYWCWSSASSRHSRLCISRRELWRFMTSTRTNCRWFYLIILEKRFPRKVLPCVLYPIKLGSICN